MNESAKKRWIGNLRSGEYKQCTHMLHSGDGRFCCLGVLLDEEVDGEWMQDFSDPFKWGMTGWDSKLKSLGLDPVDGRYLATLNDNGKTFIEIADYIERRL